MKKNITLFVYLLLIGSMTTINSCKKDDDSGYQPKGNYGNSNIKTFIFQNQGFAYVSENDDYEINLSIPDIDQNTLDNSAIMTYMQPTSNTSGWADLPLNYGSTSIIPSYFLGNVQIISTNASSGLLNIKVVIISK